jgi:hypothetical protein
VITISYGGIEVPVGVICLPFGFTVSDLNFSVEKDYSSSVEICGGVEVDGGIG